jgi:hypothetical protein
MAVMLGRSNNALGCCAEYDTGLGASAGQVIGTQAASMVASNAANYILPGAGLVVGGIISLFSKLFGGGKPPDPPRSVRSAGVLQAIANCTANFPHDLEETVMDALNGLLMVGNAPNDSYWSIALMLPKSCGQAFLASSQTMLGTVQHTNAKNAIKGLVSTIEQAQVAELTDQEWIDAYRAIGFVRIATAARSVPAPVNADSLKNRIIEIAKQDGLMAPPKYQGAVVDITGAWSNGSTIFSQSGSDYTMTWAGNTYHGYFISPNQFFQSHAPDNIGTVTDPNTIHFVDGNIYQRTIPVAQTAQPPITVQPALTLQPVPSGQTTIITAAPATPPSWMLPAQDGQATVVPVQAGIVPSSVWGWLALGGLFLFPLLFGNKRQGRRKRPARGTTVTRRY